MTMKSVAITLLALLIAVPGALAQDITTVDTCVVRETADWTPPTTLDAAREMRVSLEQIIETCQFEEATFLREIGAWFTAIPDNTMNARSCPSTTCERVDQVEGGIPVPVFGHERDDEGRQWYSLDLEGGSWIAGWLTRGGPDSIIDVAALHGDERTGCDVYVDFIPARRMRMVFLVSGTLQTSVVPRLYLPGSAEPLPLHGQYYRTFADGEDETFIRRGHSLDTTYPDGLYRIEIELFGDRSTIGFAVDATGEYGIHVICNPESRAGQ